MKMLAFYCLCSLLHSFVTALWRIKIHKTGADLLNMIWDVSKKTINFWRFSNSSPLCVWEKHPYI